MLWIIIFSLTALLFFTTPSFAQSMTGNDLKQGAYLAERTPNGEGSGYFDGLICGIFDSTCIKSFVPEGVNFKQLRAVVLGGNDRR